MNCQRPLKNKETNQWEVWDFAYEENGKRYYELHKFFTYKEAIEFWKIRNPKTNATSYSKPYVVKIVEEGNGEWYHGYENPLAHRWYKNGNRATCLVCHQVIEMQFCNEA